MVSLAPTGTGMLCSTLSLTSQPGLGRFQPTVPAVGAASTTFPANCTSSGASVVESATSWAMPPPMYTVFPAMFPSVTGPPLNSRPLPWSSIDMLPRTETGPTGACVAELNSRKPPALSCERFPSRVAWSVAEPIS
jgi:hypothetical protein